MSQSPPKNKVLLELYKSANITPQTASAQELELAIRAVEFAREQLKEQERKQKEQKAIEIMKKQQQGTSTNNVLQLPPHLKRVTREAFWGNKHITTLILNEGLTEIEEFAFANCSNLKKVVFPQNRIQLRKGCFRNCTSLKEVVIPNVSNIGSGAFENCSSLERVLLPTSLSNLYIKAFKNCRSLKTVLFQPARGEDESNFLGVYSKVFENCVSLKTISFEKNCYLDTMAFYNCTNLKEIRIHDTRQLYRTFEGCSAKVILNSWRTKNGAFIFL